MVQMSEIHGSVCFDLQTLAGGHRGRSHGDGQTGAPSGVGVSDLRGRSCLSERPEHGRAAIPHQTVGQPRHQLQVLHQGLVFKNVKKILIVIVC